jgi:hypothetical protein
MTSLMRSGWLVAAMMVAAVVGCSVTRRGKCTSCDQGMVYPPVGSYEMLQPSPEIPPVTPAPTPMPVPSATEPGMPPAPPPPLGARIPATLQGIRYSTSDFFHNANNNVRAMFTR